MKSRYWLLVFGTIVISPIILYVLISQPWGFDAIGGEEAPKVWLGFWGGYIGAIISAAVAFIILNKQLNQNHTENEDNRALQLKVLEHSNAQQRLNDIKSRLVDFQVAFNLLVIFPIIENVINGRYKQEDMDRLTFLTRDIDEKAFWIEVSTDQLEHNESMNQYNIIYNEIFNEYGLLISDILLIIDLLRHLPAELDIREDYVIHHIRNDRPNRIEKRDTLRSCGVDISDGIEDVIADIGDYENIDSHLRTIMTTRCNNTLNKIASLKESLKKVTLNLIETEQDRINSLFE
ncbi:MAG: hypothetical protein R3Y16_00020 [Rikenellaceae bacterium]